MCTRMAVIRGINVRKLNTGEYWAVQVNSPSLSGRESDSTTLNSPLPAWWAVKRVHQGS